MTTTPALRIAVQSDSSDWVEITSSDDAPVKRVRTGSLGQAAQATSRSSRPVFVDLDVHVSDTVANAYAEYAADHPGWSAGTRTGVIVHPGTVATLASLLGDVSAAHVADGVTLRGPDAAALARIVDDVTPLLAARGVAVRTSAA
ncbi:hypothetical protein nbrc107696_35260 [Gordonia spumicola]|uniref:Uncharacterized protein n=1 Tax=Gordonia spumicola TaxID=589161 RepID=A0A7I9VDI9_9ACTN|nr:hypothetical protein [Gordonia spumicola]GEE03080.1 hypothetical protein nbrc107696_35260 [Gordonia spumicola]